MMNILFIHCRRASILAATLLLTGCFGGGNSNVPHFASPNSIALAPGTPVVEGAATEIAYIANLANGTISVLDVGRERIFDTDELQETETPLTIGGAANIVVTYDSGEDGIDHVVLAIDQSNRRLFAINALDVTIGSTQTLAYSYRDIGDTTLAVAGRPVFRNAGRSSDPTISDITTSIDATISENWRVIGNGDDVWRIFGSISGEQVNRATSEVPYRSDNVEVRFTIFEGGNSSTNDDTYYFGTVVNAPLNIDGNPFSAIVVDDRLYIGDAEGTELDVLNLTNFTFEASIDLDDGTGEDVLPSSLTLMDGNLIVTNSGAGNSILTVNIETSAVTAMIIGSPTSGAYVRDGDPLIYLLPTDQKAVLIFDSVSNSLSGDTIGLNFIPTAMSAADDTNRFEVDAIVGTTGLLLDAIDLDRRRRVDLEDRGSIESFASRPFFFDFGADSNPAIIEVLTNDGVTITEDWQLIFEGVLPGTKSTTGALADAVLTDVNATFVANGVQAGDIIEINPGNADREELTVVSVDDEMTLTLSSTPAAPAADVFYQVRVGAESYVMIGTLSGTQNRRVFEDQSASSDNEEIRLSVVSDPAKPTTRDDYFTFRTDDGIDGIVSRGSLPAAITTAPQSSRGIVAYQATQSISLIRLSTLREESSID